MFDFNHAKPKLSTGLLLVGPVHRAIIKHRGGISYFFWSLLVVTCSLYVIIIALWSSPERQIQNTEFAFYRSYIVFIWSWKDGGIIQTNYTDEV